MLLNQTKSNQLFTSDWILCQDYVLIFLLELSSYFYYYEPNIHVPCYIISAETCELPGLAISGRPLILLTEKLYDDIFFNKKKKEKKKVDSLEICINQNRKTERINSDTMYVCLYVGFHIIAK